MTRIFKNINKAFHCLKYLFAFGIFLMSHSGFAQEDNTYKPNKPKVVSYRDLDRDERETIDVGYIETPSYVIGGVLGTWIGLGLGHGIQGRFSQMGWVFTAGELGSIALAAGGIGQCITSNNCSSGGGAILLGYAGFIGFRIWEIIDVWAAPPFHNKRYLRLKKSLGEEDEPDASFYIAPLGNSLAMGLQFRF